MGISGHQSVCVGCEHVCVGGCGCARVCTGVRGCARVCTSVRRCAWVFAGMRECARVCTGVRGYARVCPGVPRCVRVCTGVRWCVHGYAWVYECMWDEFSEFLLENRIPTSADFNTYPIRIFSKRTTYDSYLSLYSIMIDYFLTYFTECFLVTPNDDGVCV